MLKKIFTTAFVILLSACTIQFNLPEPQFVAKPFNAIDTYDSVGKISVKQKGGVGEMSGTAFAYDEDKLLTAAHVCVSMYEMQVAGAIEENIKLTYLNRNLEQEAKDGVKILEIDEPHDICVVELKDHGLKPVKFADYSKLKVGDSVYIVGAPMGFMISAHKGEVMDKEIKGHPVVPLNGKLLVSAAAAGGNSGSPVFDSEGKVVGILVMGAGSFDHLSFCVRAPTVERFLKIVGM